MTDYQKNKFLICCDLDRTLIPNGKQPESPQARPLFSDLSKHPSVSLAYVSGRNKPLIQDAINHYELPMPDYAIGDVGSSIYHITNQKWEPLPGWQSYIDRDWRAPETIAKHLSCIKPLTPQGHNKQSTHKLSYYTSPALAPAGLIIQLKQCLAEHRIQANIIWSLDEANHQGLLDILPKRANKYLAICFLMKHLGIQHSSTVFAGDSGNDLDVLTSDINAILVRNAAADVYQQAISALSETQQQESLYLATGGFMGTNGNYASGVLEGTHHFLPELGQWLQKQNEK